MTQLDQSRQDLDIKNTKSKLTKETEHAKEYFDKLTTNFEIFSSQLNPDVIVDSNADGSYDLKQRETRLYTPEARENFWFRANSKKRKEKQVNYRENAKLKESTEEMKRKMKEVMNEQLKIQKRDME